MPKGGELSRALRSLRERSGLSQAALAKACGTSQGQVSSYELGKADPGATVLVRMLSAMGYDFADLDAALREVRGEPPRNHTPPPGTAPPEARDILRPQIEDELIRQEVDRRVGEILGAVLREMTPAPEGRSKNET